MNKNAAILAVDDTSESLALLVKILTPAGYQVRPADSGELALAAVAAHPPDLILLDVRMKGLDGLEVCRRLKAQEGTRHIPIILISAFADVKEWIEGLQLGAADYITKPFQSEELLTRVKTHLALSRANVSLEQQAAALRLTNEQLQSEIVKRQRAEEELQRETTLLRNIINASTDFIFVKDRNLRSILCNKAYAGALGKHPEELYGKTDTENGWPLEQVHGDPSNGTRGFEADDRDALTGKTIHNPSDPAIVGQEVRFFDTVKIPLRDAFGTTFGVLGVARDITERKQAEQALRQSEEHFHFLDDLAGATRTLVASEQIMAVTSRMLGEHLRASRCAYADVRQNGEQFIILHDYTDGCASTVGHYQLSLFGARAVATLQGGDTLIVRNVEEELLPGEGADMFNAIGIQAVIICPQIKDGVLRAMMAVHQTTPRDWMPGEVALVQEVVERCWATIGRRTAEENLRESNERFHQLADNITDVFWIASPDFNTIHYISAGYEKIWGRSTGSLCANPHQWAEAILPEERDQAFTAFAPIMANAPEMTVEYRIARPDGSIRWIHDRGFQVRDAEGKLVRLAGIASDITERKQTEEVLRQRLKLQDQLARIAATVPGMIYSLRLRSDSSTQMPYASGALSGIFNLQPKDVIEDASPIFSLIHPDDLGHVQATMAESSSTLNPWRDEFRVGHVSRGEIWVEGHSVPQREPDGSVLWHGFIQDITERKRTEVALRASESEFRALAEAMPQMVWITRPDGWNIYFSQQWMDYTGLTLEESLGHDWNKPFHPEDQQRAWDAWQDATRTTGTYSVECRLRRADGIYRWWLIRGVPQRDTSGDVLKWFGTCTDIHDMKSAELEISRANEALSESKHFADSIAENSSSTIYVFDLETRRTVYSNHHAGESLGYSSAQIIELGENLLPTIMHPEDLPRIEQQLARFAGVPDSRVLDIEYRVKHASGDWHWMWARETVFNRRPNGTPRQILGTAQDITERKRAEAELKQTHGELVDASRRGGMAEIATNVLHNVGNVLNSVNVSTGLIVESVKKSRIFSLARVVGLLEEHAHDLGTFITTDPRGKHVPAHLTQLSKHLLADQAAILSELDALRRNVEHIKDIVAMQQNYATVGGVKEMIDVVTLVEDSLRLNEGAFNRHGVEIIREFETVPLLNVEKHKVLQILVNLERNAKYACDESERADRRLTVRVTDGEGWIKISVMDNGVGIAPENLTRIFNHGFTTRKGGHGFGLHSGALAAKEMGGSLTVHSDGPGQGATFTLELPCQTREN